MASSGKSSRSSPRFPDLAGHIRARLATLVRPRAKLAVGLSGGVDSVVLLDCLQRLAPRLRVKVSALHINHQLSPNAGSWEKFCRRLCQAKKIPFVSARVVVPRGESVEAAARSARYSVFSRQRADFIVLAQHQDDQVETLLLQLLRGAGVRGLASMPLLRMADGGRRMANDGQGRRRSHASLVTRHLSPAILRPLLDVTRAEILAYARARHLEWIEDESNANTDLRRNFLRHRVLPLVAQGFPAYRPTVARAAHHLAEASGLLDELAAQDGAGQIEDGALVIDGLRQLSLPRARNLLRFFLVRKGVLMPSVERLEEALRQVLTARDDARVAVALDGGMLRRFAGRIYLVPALPPVPPDFARKWRGERRIDLPELGGVLEMRPGRNYGISLTRLRGNAVTIRARHGGERIQPDPRRPRRSLKNLLQEAHIAPWKRDRLPLIYCGNTLVWVPEIGVDSGFRPRAEEPALNPRWRFTT